MIGIYRIKSKIDQRYYIGSSIDIDRRFKQHQWDLNKKVHPNPLLQNFVNKYGIDNLLFELIEETTLNQLLIKEQEYLDKLDIESNFNISKNASAFMLGKKHSVQTLKKMSISQSKENNPMFGIKRSKEVIDAMVKGRKLRGRTEEEKLKRLINLPIRKEVSIIKDNSVIRCFSIVHAANLMNVSCKKVNYAIQKNRKINQYEIILHSDKMYNVISPKLISMLKTL